MERIVRKVYCGANRIISSLGQNTPENYSGVLSYDTNITKSGDGSPVCLIDQGKLDFTGLENYTRAERLCIIALADVIGQCGVRLDNARTLLIISTTKGNIDCIKNNLERSQLWAFANTLASHFHCASKPLIVSNACVSGVEAAVTGARFIEERKYDHIYILGIDIVSEFIVSGFNSFKSISPTLCKPYDSSRDGLTLGEGCAVLLLTARRELSASRIIVSGGGMSNDANHISGPSRTGDGLAFAIEAALSQARLPASDISFINAHGTGTPYNDEMESRALHLLSLDGTPCNSLKPYIGHTLGASGVIEIILSIEQLRNNLVAGVKGYQHSGIPFRLNLSAAHRTAELNHCLKTASGFGGTNAAIILSKEPAAGTKFEKDARADIVHAGHVEITKSGIPFAQYIRSEYKALAETNLKFFKMDNLSKLGYIASCKLMSQADLPYSKHRIGIVLANRNSSLDSDINHQKINDMHLAEGASPAVFVYTLANIAAAEIAIKHKFQGESITFVSEHKNMEFLQEYSRNLIERNRCDAVIYGWCDLLGEDYNAELNLIKKL